MNDTVVAALLGVVEGLTEYLPVSSTGHLILFNDILQFKSGIAETFDVVIQSGAILSVVILFWPRFRTLFGDGAINRRLGRVLAGGKDDREQLLYSCTQPGLFGNAGLVKLALVSFPPALLGLLAHDWIKEKLFAPVPIAAALIVGAFGMFWAEMRTKGEGRAVDTLTTKDAILIGLFQCLSLWPGMSRAAWTIIGGMLMGLSRRGAAEFSFLAAVPLILAASAYDFYKNFGAFTSADYLILMTGLGTSFLTALVAVATFIGIVQRVSLRPFAIYRIILGVVVLVLMYAKHDA